MSLQNLKSAPKLLTRMSMDDLAQLSKGWSEDQHQEMLFIWQKQMEHLYPDIDLLHSIPNGAYMHISTAQRINRTGRKKGVPDVMLPVAKRGYAGLYIEMKKVKGGQLSEEQKRWIPRLRAQGYKVEVAKGFVPAITILTDYLDGWDTPGLSRIDAKKICKDID